MLHRIGIIIAVVSFALTVGLVSAWEPPETCDDDDREVPGNRSTPCKFVLPEVTKVDYQIEMTYPYCWERMVFHMPGMTKGIDPKKIANMDAVSSFTRYSNSQLSWVNYPDVHRYSDEKSKYLSTRLLDGGIVSTAYKYSLDSSVGEWSQFGNPTTDRPNVLLWAEVSLDDHSVYYVFSNAVERPTTHSKIKLLNACLDLVRQEKQDREHQAQLARQLRETEARLEAEADARTKEEEQARREAETQKLIAAKELAAATESRLRIAEIELIRFQTLETQLKHQEAITAILNDIVRIRLAGQEDRARIANEYLSRAGQTAANFAAETQEAQARIDEYIKFNAELIASIQEYNNEIISRLRSVRESVAEQERNIVQIRQDYEAAVMELNKLEQSINGDIDSQ